MSSWKKIIGTQEQEFRVGLTGAKIASVGTGLEVKNASDNLTDIKALTFTGSGAYLTDISISGANITGEVPFAAVANSVAGGNVSGQVFSAASADVAYSVDGANVVGIVSLATTAYSVDGANVVGQVANAASADIALSVAGANVTGEVTFAATANAVAGANVSGQVANAASADVALSVAGANVSGQVANAASADVALSVAGANVVGQVTNAASSDVALSVAGANVTGEVPFAATANAVAGANVSGQVANAASADVALSVAGANVSGQVANAASADVALSVAGANVVGEVATANYAAYAGNVTIAAQPIITSVGTLTSLTVAGVTALGAVGNVKITGGTTGQMLTTDGTGNLSFVTPTVFTPLKYTREWHVSPTSGNDTTGNGSYEKPYATIMKAHSVIISGEAVFLHGGVYTENVTWTKTNTDIIGLTSGGLIDTSGTWIVGTTTGASVRLRDISFNGTFTQNGTGRIFFSRCNVKNTFTKTSGEYLQANDTEFSAGVSINSAGNVVIKGGQTSGLTVNHASAIVNIGGLISGAVFTNTLGTLLVNDSIIYSATPTTAAITSAAGTATYLYNTTTATSSGTQARVTLAGFWSMADVRFDRANSTLTGTNLGTVSYSDALTVFGITNLNAVGNVKITGGTSGQFLRTDGTGNLSFASVDATAIQNGTSNVKIATAAGNIAMSVAGTSNVVVVSSGAMDLTGNLNITGNVNVTGNLNYQNVTDMVVGDPLIFIGANNSADTFDLGFSALYNNGSNVHTGFARDATDGTWKLFDGVATAPTTTVDFASGSLGAIAVGNASVGNLVVTGDVTAYGIVAADSLQIDGETDTDTLVVQNGADLGDVATLTIDGGNAGEVLSTDGSGVLSWIPFPSTADALKTVLVPFQYSTASAMSVPIPVGSIIDEVRVIVDAAFDGAAVVAVGNNATVDAYAATTDTLLSLTDRFDFPQSAGALGAADNIVVTVTGGGATMGSGRVIVSYSTPV
jgi:hypothetical protein